jgi:RNA polymerase sigma-B factor
MSTHTRSRPVVGLGPEDLIRRYQDEGDRAARDAAVESLIPLVASLCRRYEGRAEWDDLMQVATLGLVKAIERFDPDHGYAISSFAVPTILGELRRYFRDRTWAVRPPRSLQERSLLVSRAIAKLTALHGRSPVPAVVAEHLGMSEEDVVEAIVAGRAYSTDSLDAPAGSDDDESATLGSRIGQADQELAKAEQRTLLAGLMDVLSDREVEILRLRFEEDLTQAEIGKQVGVSQMQVSRLIRAALDKMRAAAEAGA